MTTITKYHWFWAWNDDKEEAWLRQMAQQGWHLSQVGFPSFYTFEQGAPRDVAYRLDFFTGGKDKADYLQILQRCRLGPCRRIRLLAVFPQAGRGRRSARDLQRQRVEDPEIPACPRRAGDLRFHNGGGDLQPGNPAWHCWIRILLFVLDLPVISRFRVVMRLWHPEADPAHQPAQKAVNAVIIGWNQV